MYYLPVRLHVLWAAGFLVAGVCVAGEECESLRVYETRPATFEYILTSGFASPGGKPILSFNDRRGKTVFVSPGDRLGGYTITSAGTVTTRVFEASVNAWQNSVAWQAVLEMGSSGSVQITLDQGRPCPRAGWMAALVSLDTGSSWDVGEGDAIPVFGKMLEIVSITETSLVARLEGARLDIPAIMAVERMWVDRLQARAASSKVPEAGSVFAGDVETAAAPKPGAAQPVAALPVRKTIIEIKRPPRFCFGTEYYYPGEFQVVPEVRDSTGKVICPAIVAPRTFKRAWSGSDVRYSR